MAARGRHGSTQGRLAVRRVGEIDSQFDLIRESWRGAGPGPHGAVQAGLNKTLFMKAAASTMAEPLSLTAEYSSKASESITDNRVETKSALLADWCQALRLHHWVKNLILFIPLALSHTTIPTSIWVAAIAGFLLLSICASGTYIINDVLDREADRTHAQKKHRPFAAGRIRIANGLAVAGVLIAGSLVGATFLSSAFSALLFLYLALTLTYSLKLKQLPLLDVATLSGLHTLRLAMGIALSHSLLPGSLIFAGSLAFLSLALAKRYSEIIHRGAQYSASTSGRGYFATDATIALAVGIGCALVATQITVFYLLEILPTEILSTATLLWSVPILLAYGSSEFGSLPIEVNSTKTWQCSRCGIRSPRPWPSA